MPRHPVVLNRPLTPAERKARQRQRERRAVIEAIGAEDKATMKALVTLLSPLGAGREPDRAAYRAWLEIGRRNGWLRDGHITDPMEDS